MRFEIGVYLNGLKPEDVVVELLLGRQTDCDTCATPAATAWSGRA